MSRAAKVRLRLYVADGAQNSALARANLSALCKAHLPVAPELEVVDVLRRPERALADAIFMTPTLVKLWPLPVRRIVGTLSQTETVLQALGLDSQGA